MEETNQNMEVLINKNNKESRKYKYYLGHLKKRFEERGMRISSGWIYRQEKKGKLTFPRSTTNIKSMGTLNREGAVRVLTRIQMEEIVKAFLPGGKGYWHPKGR